MSALSNLPAARRPWYPASGSEVSPVAGAIAALVVRFRRSRGIERQQLKWFTYAAALTPLPFFAYEFAPSISGLLRTLILPLVPISVGVAILRYRLYEIDRILNRALLH